MNARLNAHAMLRQEQRSGYTPEQAVGAVLDRLGCRHGKPLELSDA